MKILFAKHGQERVCDVAALFYSGERFIPAPDNPDKLYLRPVLAVEAEMPDRSAADTGDLEGVPVFVAPSGLLYLPEAFIGARDDIEVATSDARQADSDGIDHLFEIVALRKSGREWTFYREVAVEYGQAEPKPKQPPSRRPMQFWRTRAAGLSMQYKRGKTT